ncbi:diguanylate cyclase (GGDEF) domain-containing protein [Pseudobutyrivibrio sp. YE44]|uniref:GGDEF domain-containing protein n=1 Tax=Pseudobutyrivibrio sp. YE44 TaxID=1520802 RepID=UPI00088BDCA3|nr:GGDEF domain-containing protein [Pseudobutyrivibrio sp. YE44]SDB11705.1 diguanylate cyclase (GGDEF) domain-containing protein [Pseudobutyrivibrio sp. YE44]
MLYRKIKKEELDNFYQAKFSYYRKVGGYCAITICVLEILYFITDCQLYGRFASETLIPRLSVLLPLAIFCVLAPRIKSYKQGVFLYYLIPHAAMWSTIWAIYHLENRDFAREGFIVMHFAFLAIGMAMPLIYHIPFHLLLLFNIYISNCFNHYEHYDMMITLAFPLVLGVFVMLTIIENTYADAYLTKQQLETNSVSDRLTGIYNRFIMNEITGSRSEKFKLRANDLFILMLDIDHFKDVNDNYGHEAGDEILKFVALQIKSQIYKTDYVIRWGGEEFIVLLVDYDDETAFNLAEKLRNDIKTIDNEICPITISIGFSKYNNVDTYKEAIDKSDQALYYAKEHGRDQVIKYEDL